MEWWNTLIRGMGTANAPFGFAPVDSPSQGQVDPAYNAGMQMLGNVGMGMLASGEKNPMTALGKSYLVASQNAQQQNKDQYVAAKMLEEADAKKQERAREQEKQKWLEDQISQLDPKVQGIARMMPEKFFGAQIEQMFPKPGAANTPEYGLNPIALADENGKFLGWGQMSKSGGLFFNGQPVNGSGIRPMDPSSLNFAKSSGTAQGTASGEAVAAAPGDIAAADLALGKINDLRTDPNRAMGTGASSVFNVIPSTPGYDYQSKVDEVTAGAFLTAIQQMRGLGQLSNAEGQTAKAAVTRMKTATSEQAFLEALADYEDVVLLGKQRAQNRLNSGSAIQSQSPAFQPSSEDPLGLR